MAEIKINIDGQDFTAEEGGFLLKVLQENGFYIPTFCNHEAIEPYGVCRMCVVELVRDGWSKIVTSCNFPVKEGQKFVTNSDKIRRIRKTLMELMIARSYNVPEVMEVAKKLGVTDTPYPMQEEGCILCGLCVRTCEEVVGVSAIGFHDRGPKREICSPFMDEATRCIGCGSCVYICPTRYIKMEDKNHRRSIPLWKVDFEMAICKKCGNDIAPKKQLEYFRKIAKLPDNFYDYCLNCRP